MSTVTTLPTSLPKLPPLDTHDALRYLWLAWRILGMNPFGKWQQFYWIYSLLINSVFTILFPLHLVVELFFHTDFVGVIANLTISISSAFSTLKQFIIFYHIPRNLRQAPVHLQALDRRAERRPQEREQLEQMVRFCHRIFFVVFVAYNLALHSYGLSGLFRHRLPFEGWLPFDWTRSQRAYLLAYCFQMFGMGVQLVQNLSNDSYAITYLVVLVAHLRVLNERIARLGSEKDASDEHTYRELVACVQDHRECQRYYECIRPVISGTILVQFLITGFVLCITAIDFVNSRGNVTQLLASVIYLSCILIEVLPCCWYTDEVVIQMNELTTALYKCHWYARDLRFRRSLIIFMQRSQKINIISAADLAPVTLQTFLKIIQFAFSMFTILSNARK